MPRLGSVSFISVYPCESGNETLLFPIQVKKKKSRSHSHTRLNHVHNIIKRKERE